MFDIKMLQKMLLTNQRTSGTWKLIRII